MTKRRTRGEGGVRQRRDGRWQGAIDLGWQGGKRRRKYVTQRKGETKQNFMAERLTGVSQQAIQVRLSQTGLIGRQRRCGQISGEWRLPRSPRTGTPEAYHRRALVAAGAWQEGRP